MLDRFRTASLLLVCALFALPSRAEEVIYGPDGAPTVVQRKLHTMTGRWEVGLSFDTALNTALVDQNGAVLGLSYHPNEWFDVSGELLFNVTALSTLAQNVRVDLCRDPPNCRSSAQHKDEFANDNQLRYGLFGVARLAPIYGKFDLASELSVHFQAYLLGGVGALGVHRESVNLCNDPGTDECNTYQSSDAVKPTGQIGGGFRFYLGQRWSIRTEMRAYFFGSSYKADNDLTAPSSGTSQSYLAIVTTLNAGVSIIF